MSVFFLGSLILNVFSPAYGNSDNVKEIAIIQLKDQPQVVVRTITRNQQGVEFYSFKECSSINSIERNGEKTVYLNQNECMNIGKSFYKVSDVKDARKKIEETFSFDYGSSQANANISIIGLLFMSNGVLVYGSDNSKVPGMRFLDKMYNSFVRTFVGKDASHRTMMSGKWVLSSGSLIVGMQLAWWGMTQISNDQKNEQKVYDSHLVKSGFSTGVALHFLVDSRDKDVIPGKLKESFKETLDLLESKGYLSGVQI